MSSGHEERIKWDDYDVTPIVLATRSRYLNSTLGSGIDAEILATILAYEEQVNSLIDENCTLQEALAEARRMALYRARKYESLNIHRLTTAIKL